jgi:hypothetical protein
MPQPTLQQIQQYRNDLQSLVAHRAAVERLGQVIDETEDCLLEWLEDQQSGDSAEIHGFKLSVHPEGSRVNWQQAFRDFVGDDAADQLIMRVEVMGVGARLKIEP